MTREAGVTRLCCGREVTTLCCRAAPRIRWIGIWPHQPGSTALISFYRTYQQLGEETVSRRMPVPNRTDNPNAGAYKESSEKQDNLHTTSGRMTHPIRPISSFLRFD